MIENINNFLINTNSTNLDLFIFVVALLVLLFFNSKRVFKNSNSINALSIIIFLVFSIVISDGISTFSTNFHDKNAATINYIFSTILFVSIEFLSLAWLYYTITELNLDYKSNIIKTFIYVLPTIVIALFTSTTYWTGLMFSVDDINNYTRGPLYMAHTCISTFYLLVSAFLAYYKSKKEILPDLKNTCINIFAYSLVPILGGVLQVIATGSAYFSLSIVISINMLYLNNLKKDAILDPLTKLNNKLQFNIYLQQKTLKINKYNLYLILFDMNNFKRINDEFGHLEGDKAIIVVSNVIKSSFSGTGAFCARCGGDEFGVIVELEKHNLLKYIESVHKNMYNACSRLPYMLSVSIGYAEFGTPETSTIENLLKVADENMYENKEKMKLSNKLSEQPI